MDLPQPMDHDRPLPVSSWLKRQRPLVVWFTGLSGTGKSTLADRLHEEFASAGIVSIRLDGDVLRAGLNRDLGFSAQDRSENIRRAAELSKLMADAGLVVICSFISPFRKDRESAAGIIGEDRFMEVYLECPLSECRARDVKGLYAGADAGQVVQMTGMTSPYEPPLKPNLVLRTDTEPVDVCLKRLVEAVIPAILNNRPHDD